MNTPPIQGILAPSCLNAPFNKRVFFLPKNLSRVRFPVLLILGYFNTLPVFWFVLTKPGPLDTYFCVFESHLKPSGATLFIILFFLVCSNLKLEPDLVSYLTVLIFLLLNVFVLLFFLIGLPLPLPEPEPVLTMFGSGL